MKGGIRGAGASHRLIISSSHHPSSPHQAGTARATHPPPPSHHRSRMPRRHRSVLVPCEAVRQKNRPRTRHDLITEAAQPQREHQLVRANRSKPPRRLPVPRHEETGRDDGTMRGRTGRAKRMTTKGHRRAVSKQTSETDDIADDIPTTSRRHHKSGHGTSSVAKPSDEKREQERLTSKQAGNRSTTA